ncbi:MAG TPA: glycosyltransferase [Acidimicrobiales bacterium]|nr:glycosyltransferase [Acidimicrobiales bacterium]
MSRVIASPETTVAYSPTWNGGPTPRIAAVVSTFGRPEFLEALVDSLSAQSLPHDQYEVVIVDNGSLDTTWPLLQQLAERSPARMAVTTLPENRGPGGGRNHGFTIVRAPMAAITDDDCLPTSGWLAAMLAALESGNDVVQGQVQANPIERDGGGPWDHTKWITTPTPFFETCNVAYRVSAFRDVGGFDETDALTAQVSGRAFGEDALLAWRVHEAGGHTTFAEESLVYHRIVPATFGDWLNGQRNLVGFPGLGNRSPLVASWFWHRHFLSKESALFDVAIVAVVAALVLRRPWLALGLLPWVRHRWSDALYRARGEQSLALFRLAQLALSDGVSLASLLEGSVRHKRLVL